MHDFEGRVAVITGGASGMGRAFADRFAAAGMKLVLGDIEEDALSRAVTELRDGGADAVGVPTDVARLEDVETLRDRALDAFGRVHVVCNNAGVAGGAVIDTPIEVWRWVLGVNLWGVIHGCHVFVPLLVEQDEGHVVNTASLAGLSGSAGLGVYCTSKFAVVGLSESLHHDLAARDSRVGVSVLCPGFVQTRIFESHRNMPDDVRTVVPATPTDAATDAAQRAVISAGIPASDAADAVFEAIRERRFFVLPHPRAARASAEARLEWMAGRTPGAPDLESLLRP
jgi:NAD(P)-dependent dehydrogenase (short-subunit alcohol dehydrogenase family)